MEPPHVQPPPPPPAAPFNPSARPRAGGCPKPLIIGCLAVIVLGGIALLGGFWWISANVTSVLKWSFNQMETGILAQLPKDVTAEERERLQQAFAGVIQGIDNGSVTPDRLQPVQFKIMEISRKGANMTREDVQQLTSLLEGVVARESPEQAGPPPGAG